MKRIQIDLFLDNKVADELVDLIKPYLAKSQNINIGKPNEEKSVIRHHICHHDTGQPCEAEVVEAAK